MMEKLKVFIVDDERSARELLVNLLADFEVIEIVGQAENVEEARIKILKLRPDVLILDIQMPRQDGFSLIEQLQLNDILPEVIFITAYEKYAIRAIKASAFDYLLKPVKKNELVMSLSQLLKKLETKNVRERFELLLHQLGDHKKLKFKNRTGFYMIDPNEIIYCEADSNYSILELDSGKNFTVTLNLGKVEELLPKIQFIRISRSTIINIHYLNMVDRKTMTCTLVNESTHTVSISRKYLKRLEEGCENQFSK